MRGPGIPAGARQEAPWRAASPAGRRMRRRALGRPNFILYIWNDQKLFLDPAPSKFLSLTLNRLNFIPWLWNVQDFALAPFGRAMFKFLH
eukprot:5482781-Alexandrium_andersonii.AAC.1